MHKSSMHACMHACHNAISKQKPKVLDLRPSMASFMQRKNKPPDFFFFLGRHKSLKFTFVISFSPKLKFKILKESGPCAWKLFQEFIFTIYSIRRWLYCMDDFPRKATQKSRISSQSYRRRIARTVLWLGYWMDVLRIVVRLLPEATDLFS
jgi:hypothetical protein